MLNPNKGTSEEVLRRLKEGSYERMRVELKNSVESKMRDFGMSWDDVGRLLGIAIRPQGYEPSRGDTAKWQVIQGEINLTDLNALTHLFSCEPYVIFRPRDPWVAT